VRLPTPIWLLAFVAVGCSAARTSGPPASLPSPTSSQIAAPVVHVLGRSYVEQCLPVAEALVDVPVSEPGAPFRVRAIAGVWDRQAVAVVANDRQGCGRWTLAIAAGLSAATRDQIRAEVRRGVATFGVTASPVVNDPNKG
jgi:hypothetical protein